MNFLKKLGHIAFSCFLAFRSIELLKQVLNLPPESIDIKQAFWVAFLFCLFITGTFAFVGFVFPTYKILPDRYYHIKSPKILLKIYSLLKVNIFKKALLLAFWGKKKNRNRYFNGNKSGIKQFIENTKQSEFGHLAAFIALSSLSILLIYNEFWLTSIITLFINLIGNFYPVLLQRFHRSRITKWKT